MPPRHSTQYFEPPYAKIMMQIRTKSQYPYLFNIDTSTAILHVRFFFFTVSEGKSWGNLVKNDPRNETPE